MVEDNGDEALEDKGAVVEGEAELEDLVALLVEHLEANCR